MTVDSDVVREAHRRFPTGVTVVTTVGRDADAPPVGLAVNAFASVSLDPPSVLVCVSRSSRSYKSLMRADVIGINLLAEHQQDLARVFASRTEDKFAGIAWRLGPSGAPLLDQVSASFEIAIETLALASTHVVIIGSVLSCACSERLPLLYLGGAFHPAPASAQQSDLGASKR